MEHGLVHLVPGRDDAVTAVCTCGWMSAPSGYEHATSALWGHTRRAERHRTLSRLTGNAQVRLAH